MKVSLNWLREFVELPEDVDEITDALVSLGHEVESVDTLSAEWTDVVIAEVTSIQPHPNADKVRVCQVDVGERTPTDVVCGAWNFDVGAKVAFASPGAVLPGDFHIGTREIRGVKSNGMICSESELGLGTDHDGILVLDGDAPIGHDFASFVDLPDVVFDLTITPNRPDAMSILGVARDLAAYFGATLTPPAVDLDTVEGVPTTTVTIADPTGCLRFTGREITGTTIGPSPFWMRQRLRISGMRPISNAVDVTNYVMLELGHPLHAFDADQIAGDHLVVRRAVDGEKMITLDDVQRELTSDDLVICDSTGPTSLAGTMGGATSEVSEETTRVFLEAATWDPPTIMWMSRRHGLRSEASARFERGVDPSLPLVASARAAALLARTSGGSVLSGVVDEVAVAVEPVVLELSSRDVERVLGGGFAPGQIAEFLKSIELDVSGSDPLTVVVPTFRPDLERPIDLVEEVARLAGFARFDETVPRGSGAGYTSSQHRERLIRTVLAGVGLSQAVHLSFMRIEDLDALAIPMDHAARRVVRVRNPLREEEGVLRTTMLPGLLGTLRYNFSHGANSGAIFEMGRVFFDEPSSEDLQIPHQPQRLAFAAFGAPGTNGIDVSGRDADIYTATAIIRVLADVLGLDVSFHATSEPGYHPGRCAAVSVNGTPAGFVGEVHPVVAQHYDLAGRVAVGEVDLAVMTGSEPRRVFRSPSVYPPIDFDLAFLVDESMTADVILGATTDAGGELVESATVFDEYRGRSDGRRSLAIRFVLRAADRTLTNDDMSQVRTAMIDAATALGAELRG